MQQVIRKQCDSPSVVQYATTLDALCNINRHGEFNLFAETLKQAHLRQTDTAVMEFKPHVAVTVDASHFVLFAASQVFLPVMDIHTQTLSLSHLCAIPNYCKVWEILQPSKSQKSLLLMQLSYLSRCIQEIGSVKTAFQYVIWHRLSWALKGGKNNLKNLADTLDHLLCILPFEVSLFEAHGIRTTSFRHPVLEDAFTSVAVFTSSNLNPLSSVVNTQTQQGLKLTSYSFFLKNILYEDSSELQFIPEKDIV